MQVVFEGHFHFSVRRSVVFWCHVSIIDIRFGFELPQRFMTIPSLCFFHFVILFVDTGPLFFLWLETEEYFHRKQISAWSFVVLSILLTYLLIFAVSVPRSLWFSQCTEISLFVLDNRADECFRRRLVLAFLRLEAYHDVRQPLNENEHIWFNDTPRWLLLLPTKSFLPIINMTILFFL